MTSRKSSNSSTLSTSSMCVSSFTSLLKRCTRSPSPVYVGVHSSWPRSRNRGRIFFHAQPADQAPCATRKVAIFLLLLFRLRESSQVQDDPPDRAIRQFLVRRHRGVWRPVADDPE